MWDKLKRPDQYGDWLTQVNWMNYTLNLSEGGRFYRPDSIGVYVIYHKPNTLSWDVGHGRWSRLAYIGMGNLSARLTAHCTGAQNGNGLIFSELQRTDMLARVAVTDDLEIAKAAERTLIQEYVDRYGRLPPANGNRGVTSQHSAYVRFDRDIIKICDGEYQVNAPSQQPAWLRGYTIRSRRW